MKFVFCISNSSITYAIFCIALIVLIVVFRNLITVIFFLNAFYRALRKNNNFYHIEFQNITIEENIPYVILTVT